MDVKKKTNCDHHGDFIHEWMRRRMGYMRRVFPSRVFPHPPTTPHSRCSWKVIEGDSIEGGKGTVKELGPSIYTSNKRDIHS